MKKNKRFVWILSCFILVICSVLYVHYVRKINSKYQNIEKMQYRKHNYGEVKTGLNMKIDRVELVSRDEIKKKYNYEEEEFLTCEQNFILAWVTIKNNTNEEIDFQLSDFYLEKDGWYNGLDLGLFQVVNENIFSDNLNEDKKVILTYSMIDTQFKQKYWNHVNLEDFRIVRYPVYPHKKIWSFT